MAKSKARRSGGTSTAATPGAEILTPQVQARLFELQAAPPETDIVAQLEDLVGDTPGGLLLLIDALGTLHDETTGQVLAAIAATVSDKEQRKAARRALHKLRSAGVAVEVPVAADREPTAPLVREALRTVQTFGSPSDGVGSRLLWIVLERPYGGLTVFNLAINDIVGVKDMFSEDMSRRRFEARLDDWQDDSGYEAVELPVAYGLGLLSEALALNAESQFPLPREFVIRRSMLGELPPPPTAALIHQHVSRGQLLLLPNLLDQSADLLDDNVEMESWGFAYNEVEPYTRDYQQAGESRLFLSAESNEARQQRILETAVDALFMPAMRRGYRRRLEETAYIFWQTEREQPARQAVAAAFAIAETGSLRSHPLLLKVLQRSIELAIVVDESGQGVPAGANRTAYTPI